MYFNKMIPELSVSDLEKIAITKYMKVPSCGALTYMHDGIEVTIRDLCNLMIILSDNTATNVLIDRLGIDEINKTIKNLGLKLEDMQLLRKVKKVGFSNCEVNGIKYLENVKELTINNTEIIDFENVD